MDDRRFKIVTAVVAVVGGVAVWVLATQLFPYLSVNHDEGVYLQQAAMLLNGQLNLWPPVEDVARPWFFVEHGNRLYPKYAPVPAAIFALGRLFGGYRLALVGIAVGNLALVSGVVSEVFDRRTGCFAAVFVVCSPLFLLTSAVFLPYAPTTLLNLAFAYGYLRSDRTGSRAWATVAGVAIGLAFFSRPFTAVLFGLPFIVHALWTMRRNRESIARHAWTAALGVVGVTVTLGYNTIITGSPFLFPYAAFAPLDGLGFGTRRLLAREVAYTPSRALITNSKVLELFVTDWIAGGILGAALAVGGVVLSLRRRAPREIALAGLFVSVAGGNLFFWGNNNILGNIDRSGDGLISYLGPYYHFDLLVPTAAFAGVAVWAAIDFARTVEHKSVDRRVVYTLTVVLVVLVAGGMVAVSAINTDERIDRNQDVTQTYTTAYEPFEDPPQHSLVLLPTPYGNWLGHPFQALRNDPGFDGPTVYTTDAHPFAAVDAFENRTVYRYVYRGPWAPWGDSPDTARLQPVTEVAGDRIRLNTTFGIPDGATSATVRVATDEGRDYAVLTPDSNELTVALEISDERVWLNDNSSQIALSGRDTVTLSVFVEYGAGDGFTYRLELPVEAASNRVRALSPRVERCHATSACRGNTAHIPETAPTGVFVRTNLFQENETHKFRLA